MNSQTRIFDPAAYIQQWYKNPNGNSEGDDDIFHAWLKQAFQIIPNCQWGIQIGCGPILNIAAFASRKVQNLILTEYNTDCFKFISTWIRNEQSPFKPDWSKHFSRLTEIEGTGEDMDVRIRSSVKMCMKVDLMAESIFQYPILMKADIIVSSLCIQAVAPTHQSYKGIIQKLKNHLKPQGYLLLLGVLDQTFYMVGEQRLPCLPLTPQFITSALQEKGFTIIKFNVVKPEQPHEVGDDSNGVFSVLAQIKP